MKSRRYHSEYGQAIVEYILVLAVVVLLVLGLAYQFNASFRVYLDNMFGNYIACLLETGELPALGGGQGGVCEEQFQKAFNAEDGQPLVDDTSAGPGGPSSGATGGDNASQGGPRDSEPRASSGGGGTTSGAADGGLKSSSELFGGKGAGGQKNVGRLAEKPEEDGKKIKFDTSATVRNRGVGELRGGDTGPRKRLDQSMIREPEEEKDRKGQKTAQTKKAGNGDGDLKPKALKVDTNRKPAQQKSTTTTEFSIGAFLRWFLIAAIIIIMVLIIGGQMLQIAKGREK